VALLGQKKRTQASGWQYFYRHHLINNNMETKQFHWITLSQKLSGRVDQQYVQVQVQRVVFALMVMASDTNP
jgi:hypothetical protein